MNTANVNLRGASGRTYDFQVSPWGKQFDRVGAVYAVLRLELDGKYTVLYIGQTEDLSSRFDSHHKQTCFDRNNKTHIGVHLDPSERNRLAIERDLVANYHPVCNG